MPRFAAIAVAAALLVGCGEDRTRPPDIRTPDAPDGTRTLRITPAGVAFTAPLNWVDLNPEGSLVGGIASKSAVVAVWRYPRTEPLPAGRGELAQARHRLIERIQERNPTFAVRSSDLTEIAGARAIELTGRQTIAGLTFDVRTAHVFNHGAELVVDAYARPVDFERVDAEVIEPLLDSLRFGPVS